MADILHPPKTTTTISPLVRSRRAMTKKRLLQQYGFFCNPNLPLWLRAITVLRHMPLKRFLGLYKEDQTAYHNLCQQITPPPNVDNYSGSDLNSAFKKQSQNPTLTPLLADSISRLTRDTRICFQFGGSADGEYDSKLYLKNED